MYFSTNTSQSFTCTGVTIYPKNGISVWVSRSHFESLLGSFYVCSTFLSVGFLPQVLLPDSVPMSSVLLDQGLRARLRKPRQGLRTGLAAVAAKGRSIRAGPVTDIEQPLVDQCVVVVVFFPVGVDTYRGKPLGSIKSEK